MSASDSRPGRADSRSGHVRDAPIATEFCVAAKFRYVPDLRVRSTSVFGPVGTSAHDLPYGLLRGLVLNVAARRAPKPQICELVYDTQFRVAYVHRTVDS